MIRRLAAGWLAMQLALCAPAAYAETPHAKLETYISALAQRLPVPARNALAQINEPQRQLLALRSYVRMGDGLLDRWSWSNERIDAFHGSAEHRQLVASVERVKREFEKRNPGYTLYANTRTRSLDVQLERWNANAGVARVARQLQRDALDVLNQSRFDHAPTAGDVAVFTAFLRTWRGTTSAPLAAPGLSLHGQARAVDFQIMQGKRVVASADLGAVRQVWEAEGWGARLADAMDRAMFSGPLKTPNEPWHYEYVGRQRTAARESTRTGG